MRTLYERLNYLCKDRGIKGGRMCGDLGISKSLMTDLKNGRKKGVNAETAQKIASYFGVPISFLLGAQPFQYWNEINHDRSGFFAAVSCTQEMLRLLWGIDPINPETASEKNIISFIAANIENATPLSDGVWVIKENDEHCSQGTFSSKPNTRSMTNDELMFALWGDNADGITDADLEDVRRYAAFVKERKNATK